MHCPGPECFFFYNNTISLLCHHGNNDYYQGVYFYGYSFWTEDPGFLKLGGFESVVANIPWYFCARTFF